MAKIRDPFLFNWQNVEVKSDLDRLRLVLEHLPDEELMQKLEKHRGSGRNEYPIRPVWNSILAGIVYQHKSVESLRRELLRNGELRELCGFNPLFGADAVPPPWVYTRFLKLLFKFAGELEAIFHRLIDELKELLPDLGKRLAADAKALESLGKPPKKREPDGRRDTDGDWGKKTYRGQREDGTLWEKLVTWFGYKLHLIVDAIYELPLGYKLTKASVPDCPQLLPLVEELDEKHPQIVEGAETLAADRGYDSEENNRRLYDDYGIKPLIDIRAMWKDKEKRLVFDRVDNIVYDEFGKVYCENIHTGEAIEMAFSGFEKDRMALKYQCPMKAYGMRCSCACECEHALKSVRVPLALNRRLFVPIARSSYKWRRLYKGRTAAERVNSRFDVSFCFEEHYIRGLKKMNLRVGLALIVMLAMAKGHIVEGRKDLMRSLVKRKAA